MKKRIISLAIVMTLQATTVVGATDFPEKQETTMSTGMEIPMKYTLELWMAG